MTTGTPVLPLTITQFHRGTLELATRCLDEVPKLERDLSCLTLVISRKTLDRIKQKLKRFWGELRKLAESDKEADIAIVSDRVAQTDGTPLSGTDVSEWTCSASVRVNAKGMLTRKVANIPLLLRLTGADLDFAQARGYGSDLRFTKENGIVLPFRIQSWDSLSQTAAVWIKLDTVHADTAFHRIRMYWGNQRSSRQRDHIRLRRKIYGSLALG